MPKRKKPFKIEIPPRSSFNAPGNFRRLPDENPRHVNNQRSMIRRKILANRECTPEELSLLKPAHVNKLREEARQKHGGLPMSTRRGLEALKESLEPLLKTYRGHLESCEGELTDKDTHAAVQFMLIDTADTVAIVERAFKALREIYGMNETKVTVDNLIRGSLEEETQTTLQRLLNKKRHGAPVELLQERIKENGTEATN